MQLNNGFNPPVSPLEGGQGGVGGVSFSEIGQLAGVHQTDWSWTPLVADFDNDGWRDLIITNGFPRDVTDRDFANFRAGPAGNVASAMMMQDSIPIVKISNYAYHNNGDLTFEKQNAGLGPLPPILFQRSRLRRPGQRRRPGGGGEQHQRPRLYIRK